MDHLASGSTDTILLEDFGQKVDLTRRIREVLVNYPEGTTVLKELIQNADDAGATKVILCLDRRHHGVDSLFSNNLAQWQGPALLAYNDAVFTEEDFVSISRIGDSKKQDQAWKTGRFGVGFNSVYHLTDLPSFVSDKYAVLFDPHGSHLPNVSAANPGKRLDFVSSSAMSLYEDQFMPYCAFGCDMKNPFSGTLFRFPLRNVNQAAVSKLSKQVYTADDISSMFSELYEEAVFCLLFLKSIISIEMYTWDAGINKPQKLYSCTVKESNEKCTQNLRGFTRISSSINASNLHLDSYLINFFCEAISGSIPKRRMETFFVVQGRASTTSKLGAFAAMAANDYDLHLLPLASVALCLSDDLPEDHFLKQGHVFCSLPLPIRTGFNAHVNGYFEVYSNRRSIWFGSDMDRGGKLRSDWNRLLLEYIVAPAYCELLVGLSKLLGPTMQYYSSWPTGLFEEPWGILAENIYKMCYSAKVLFTKLEGGKWISPAETIFQDVGFLKMEILGEALVLLGMPVVYLPGNILDTMCKYLSNFSIKFICPGMVRNFIKESEKLGTLKKSYKLLLLEYCLTDLGTEDVGKYVEGLALLPLANGDFGAFTETTEGTNYFICNDLEYSLLGLIPDIMIDRTIPSDLLCSLSEIARSSKTNLAFLNEEYLLQLFPRLFPTEWRYENKVPWNPGVCTSHPTATWFALFWDYIHCQLYDISIFGDWPILPSTSGYLYRASKMSKFISAEKLSETVQEILVKIGCKILDPAYKINHRDLCHYVSDSDAGCILNSIIYSVTSDGNEICLLFKNLSAHQRNELRRFLLDPKWYHGGCISNIHIKNAKKLPIYRVFGEQHPESNHFYDLVSSTRYLPPVGIPNFFLNGDFVFCSSIIEDEILLRYFGIERIPKPAFYRKYVLSRLGNLRSDVRDSMMLSILKELPQLCLDDPSLKESLRVLKFIPTDCGGLDCPESLYDPRVDELYVLLEESNCFPSGLFREHNVLDMLICLGLRTSVSTDTIIKSARLVESLMHEDQLKAYLHGKVLLSYLEIHANKLLYNGGSQNGVNMMVSRNYNFSSQDGLDKFWNDLRSISWCPVLNSAPHSALPWPLVSAMVAPPKIVRPREDMWLVSASSRILDGECRSLALSSSLGWSSPPSGTVIAAQLLELGKGNELVIDHALRQELAISMPKLYSLLANLIGSDEMEIVKAILEGCRWIWVGDGFSTVNEVVLNGQLHLVPYIRVIPVDLAVFKDLFLELGVPEYLKPVDYAHILCRMANKKSCIPLDAQELRATVSIAQYLAEIQSQQLHVKIYLPDILSRLIPAADLVYNDAPWFDSGENTSGDGSNVSLNSMNNIYNFVHKNISNDIAEKLGVRSLRRLFLAESSDSMYLSLSGVAEAFGQHEALTTRLKHIVEMYADGPGLLFELVQNAEDAQASEVVFLLDKTQYGTSSILSPQMAEWQGPALYCFNDSVFSSQDLYAISRIGQDSKLDKPAIGRFGLGFNCVYHFTDIPGFVSGENIVIFDPHASHLPGISPTHPGLRIKFVGRKILEQFPDQFMPFLHFGCDLQQPFPGTLFRFPLRNETAAHRSQIKKEKYSSEDVELLLSSFKEVVSESLLFLHNIQMVSIFVKDGSHHEMQLIHCVSRHSGSELVKVPHPHHSMLSFVHGNQQNRMDRDQFMDKLNKIAESDLPWNCQKTLLLEQSLSSLHLHDWIVGECIGGGRSKSKSLSAGNQSFKFIPWASVAVYLQSVNLQDLKSDDILHSKVASYARLVALGQNSAVHYRKNFIGRAFCFLPLPISTGLPTHINAYFELSSNRRDIWFGDDMAGGGKVRSEWNHCLLEDAIAPAYGRLLVLVGQEVGPCDLYFSFWPTSTDLEPWASMVRKFYAFLSVQGLLILHTKAKGGKWISPRQAIFPDLTFSNVIELVEVLSEAGLPVANVSTEIVKRFMESCPSLHFLTPQFLRRILSRHKYVFKNKDAIVTVLNYCLSDYSVTSSFVSLNGLPLLPLANGKFTSFNQRGEGDKVFVTSTEEFDLLVHSVPYLLADCSIPDNILKKLRDIANSEQTNLHVLTCFSLVELFPRILPSQWQHAKQVLWTPGHHGQPSLEWMGLFWSYLKASCNDLSVFSTWPLLPVKNDFLLQLVENSFVIRDDGWSENMSSLLQKLGFSFLRSDMLLDHSHLKNYVHDATAPGILDALYTSCQLKAIKNLFLNASKAEMRELRSFIFQSKWFSGNQIGPIQIDVIKHLPIFEFYKIEGMLTLTNPLKFLKPLDVDENLVDDNFILIESDLEKSILQNHLGIRELPKIEFYKKYIFHRMESFAVQPTILLAIFTDVKLLIEEDDSIKDTLSEMPFVLAGDGSWHHPSRLYDPRVPSLQNLLNKEAFFPNDVFSNSAILDFLTGFGLRRSLNLSGLIDVARSVAMLHECGHVDAPHYGRKLLSYLNALGIMLSSCSGHKFNDIKHTMLTMDELSHTEFSELKIAEGGSCDFDQDVQSFLSSFVFDKQENEFWSEIRIIPWCPVHTTPLLAGLPWFASDKNVATPDCTRPKSQMWQVSSKMRILNGDCYSTYVQDMLGWMDPPDIETLSSQLVSLSKSYTKLKLQSDHELHIDSILQREMPRLYSMLQGYIDADDFIFLREALDGISWLWLGDGFVPSKSVAFGSPVQYHPYLYAVTSELSEFRTLLLQLGVRLTFDAIDYLQVLKCLQQDVKGEPLLAEQLSFVQCVLEAFANSLADCQPADAPLNLLFIPNSSGILMNPSNLVYNDAPWIDINTTQKHLVHSDISNDLAKQLGVQSLRCLSLVDEKSSRNFSCMDYAKISDLLALYGESGFLLFDLLELADYSQAKKLHLVYDKRQHPRQSLLQHNLGDFQGSALTVMFEGATLSADEVCSLQLSPPWKIRGNNLNYGLGLIGSYFICDIITIVSGGYYFIFDPLGLVLTTSSEGGPSAKAFTLIGNDLTERFPDQFSPLIMNQGFCSSTSDLTFIRMPLSSKALEENRFGCNRLMQIFDKFKQHGSSALLSLKSVYQVSISTWEEGKSIPLLDYSVSIDPAAFIGRNPFLEKRWKKFQLSRIFSASPDAIKIRELDAHIIHGHKSFVDKWLVVLSLGSGKTRNMALDRRYISYNLTPFAGVAAHICQNGQPISPPASSFILSPLPLSEAINMPVTILGCFLISHISGRYLFSQSQRDVKIGQANTKDILFEAWNKELLHCVRDSYVELVLELQKIKKDYRSSAITSNSARALSYILQAYGDRIYSFWPRSKRSSILFDDDADSATETIASKSSEEDWALLIDQVIRPFYARLVDMPVWQLYSGNVVKADEGMFLSQLNGISGDNLSPARVFSFIKEHYPVFSMPFELVKEIQAIGVKVKEITPKMVRNLLKTSVSVLPDSVEMYIEVLDYCLSDIHLPDLSAGELPVFNARTNSAGTLTASDDLPSSTAAFISSMNAQRSHKDVFPSTSSSGGDALEIVTHFGMALYDFGRGVVEDMGKAAGPRSNVDTSDVYFYRYGSVASILAELKGLPFPTATAKCLGKLGVVELFIGSVEQQLLMHPFANKFVHALCLEKSFLAKILSAQSMHGVLKLRNFTPQLVSDHLRFLLTESWATHVLSVKQAPWVPWDKTKSSVSDGPHPDWIRLFWKVFRDIKGDLSLISDWPLVPAVLDVPILCRVKECQLIFIPPIMDPSSITFDGNDMICSLENMTKEPNKAYFSAFEMISSRYPWLMSLLCQLNIPIYDKSFLDSGASDYIIPTPGRSLGHAVASKLLAAKYAGTLTVPLFFQDEDRDRLFTLFASDYNSTGDCLYDRGELDVLKELPIYKTVTGSYTTIHGSSQCLVSPTAFFQPKDERCLSHSADSNIFLHALGVNELTDKEVFTRFALPDFETKASEEMEDILLYLYVNWKDLQLDSTLVHSLKETNFVRSANELCNKLFKPRDLLDPYDPLLSSVFSGERSKFAGERFATDGWLRILRMAGLCTSLHGNVIIECARKVELLGRQAMEESDLDNFENDLPLRRKDISLEIWSLAESVVVTIFSNLSSLFGNDFCEKISNIAFVPAEKGLPMIGGKKGGNRVLCRFREAILPRDWPLAWSAAPILTKLNVVPPEYSWGAFHLRSPPPFSTVLKHLQVVGNNNGEDTLSHWLHSPGMITVEEASFEILKYLDMNWSRLSTSDKKELQKVPFIPVANGTRFIKVTSLFVRLTVRLSPFAFELPSVYLPFVKILSEIGVQEVLTVDHAKDLILNIQKTCGYRRLNPNEFRAVMEILHFICSNSNKSSTNSSDARIDNIVPDDGCKLVSASSCVYVDSYGSQLLSEIDTCRIRFCHPELPENMCLTLGIKKVSDVVIEELDEQQLQVVDQIGSIPLSRLKNKLLSKQFQHALWQLINGMKVHSPSFEGMDSELLERTLNQVAYNLQFVKLLYTGFLLLPKNINITRAVKHSAVIPDWDCSPRHRSIYFISKSREKILVAEPPSFISIYEVVSIIVSQILEVPIILPIGSLLACPDGFENAMLTAMKLGSVAGFFSEGKSNMLVGMELLSQDALLVQFLPLRPFYKGEIVAWKPGNIGDKLRYGIVSEDIRPSADQAIHKIPLEIAPGKYQALLSTQVLSFKSISMGSVASMLPENSEATSENVLLNVQENKDTDNGKIKQQTARELLHGKVSAEETVRAVHDMLLIAGINMDTEQQTLLQTTLTLQEQIRELQVDLLAEQVKAETAIKEAEAAKAAWSCRVCLGSEVDTSIVPCGHVLCFKCCASVSRCPFCRGTVTKLQKIFRP